MLRIELLPQGFLLPDGTRRGRTLAKAENWQIVMTSAECPALIVSKSLHARWVKNGLIGESLFVPVNLGDLMFFVFTGGKDYMISSVQHGPYPETNIEAHAFAVALRESRKAMGNASLHDALYLEQFSLFLPTYTHTDTFDDTLILGTWLSAGVSIPATSNRLCELMTWLPRQEVQSIVREAGFLSDSDKLSEGSKDRFLLPGRPELEAFDKYLERNAGFAYRKLDKDVMDDASQFHFIRAWRNNHYVLPEMPLICRCRVFVHKCRIHAIWLWETKVRHKKP